MKILDYIIEQRKGHYCHALELTDAYDLECVIESVMMDLGEQFSLQDYLEFFNSISIYHLPDEDSTDEHNAIMEEELYSANISELVKEVYDGL